MNKAIKYWPGSRADLKVLEAVVFLTIKNAFSHFSLVQFTFLHTKENDLDHSQMQKYFPLKAKLEM